VSRVLLEGFAKSVLVHRHAFVPSVAKTLEIGRGAALPDSFSPALELDAASLREAAAGVRALWARPGARAKPGLEGLVDRYCAPEGLRLLEKAALRGGPVRLWLALAYLRRVDLPAAWKELDALCAAHPRWSWPLLVRSELGRVDIVYERALRDLDAAQRLDPRNAWVRAFRARVLFQKEPGPAGLPAMNEAVRLAPKAGWIRAWRADSRRKLGDLAGAEADLKAALALEPGYDRTYLWAGKVLRARGKPAEAERALTRGLKTCPHFEKALAERARARLELGRVDEALADLEAASKLNHRHNSLWNWTAEPEPLNEEKRRTLRLLAVHARKKPRSARAWAWLGEALTQAGEPARGLEALDLAASLDARRPRLRTWRGEALLRLGRLDEAARELDRAVAEDSQDGRARAWRGRLRQLRGRHAEAEADLSRAVGDSFIEYSWLYFWRARSRRALGRLEEAARDARSAASLEPGRSEFGELARLFEGAHEEAVR
jgi:tetratricopeptide (TPR) repeat protein